MEGPRTGAAAAGGAAALRRAWRWTGPLLGLGVVAALVRRLGSAPVTAALDRVDGRSVLVAVLATAVTTVCSAWRWRLVSAGLGMRMPLHGAVAACYRAQFLNTVLPGGVVGDLERGIRHGHASGDAGRGLRSVVWERAAGQVVQATAVVIALCLLPSPVRSPMRLVLALAMAAGAVVAVVAVVLRHGAGRPRGSRPVEAAGRVRGTLRGAAADVRSGLLARHTWPSVVVLSAVGAAGHLLILLVAARAAGVTAATVRLVPLVLLALVAMAVPANLAGWGPREGVAAWAFGAAGIGAAAGLATAVVYGVLVFVACLPGAAVLLVRTRPARMRGSARAASGADVPAEPVRTVAVASPRVTEVLVRG